MQNDHILIKLILFSYGVGGGVGGGLAPGAEFENKFLSGALAALLFSGVKPFARFCLRALSETIL